MDPAPGPNPNGYYVVPLPFGWDLAVPRARIGLFWCGVNGTDTLPLACDRTDVTSAFDAQVQYCLSRVSRAVLIVHKARYGICITPSRHAVRVCWNVY